MSIERFHTNDRMSQMVIHDDTVYLAGQVALGAPGESVADQTRAVLSQIDSLLAEAGTDKSKALSATAAPAAERAYAWKHCGAFAPAQAGTA